MIKSLLLIFITIFFTACSSSMPFTYTSTIDELKFELPKNNTLTKKLNNPKYIITSDSCANESYLLKEKRYFIEYISLDLDCSWNGLPSSYFEREFKEILKLKSMVALERIDIENYSFSTFKINDKYKLNTISIYTVFTNTFIVDFEGKLYEELLTKYKPSYTNTFTFMPRFQADYKYSMVDFNFLHHYFNREKEIFLLK